MSMDQPDLDQFRLSIGSKLWTRLGYQSGHKVGIGLSSSTNIRFKKPHFLYIALMAISEYYILALEHVRLPQYCCESNIIPPHVEVLRVYGSEHFCPCAMPVLFLPSVEKIFTFAFSFMWVSWPVILRILRVQTVPFLGTYQTRTTHPQTM